MIAPCRPAETIALAMYWAQKHDPFNLRWFRFSPSNPRISFRVYELPSLFGYGGLDHGGDL
jgi:hypothetical protein